MAQSNISNTSKLNPNNLKNFTPKEFIPQPVESDVVEFQKFFEYQKYEVTPATVENGFNAYPNRTFQFVSSLYGGDTATDSIEE